MAYPKIHKVQNNDIIVMASDGVFDNLYDNQIEKCLKMNG
jgi:serine/threonine protein phosphatase PrpC